MVRTATLRLSFPPLFLFPSQLRSDSARELSLRLGQVEALWRERLRREREMRMACETMLITLGHTPTSIAANLLTTMKDYGENTTVSFVGIAVLKYDCKFP